MTILFTKMQGLGNDFVVINTLEQPLFLTPQCIRQMADRHFGIGFDQLLLVGPPPPGETQVDFSYRIYNADGSEAQQCGNGLRCFARFVYDNRLTAKRTLCVASPSGNRTLELKENHQVRVNMGMPILEPINIPFKAKQISTMYTIQVNKLWQQIHLGVVSMGNPHAVLDIEQLGVKDIQQAPVAELGPLLAQHLDFPDHVNVGFLQRVDSHHLRLRVYERGAGETLACGSGACAAVVIGRLQGFLSNAVSVSLPGGETFIEWEGEGHPVWMTGPAAFVFTGTYVLETSST